jgi:hypothetical protein
MVDRQQKPRMIDQPEPCFVRLQLVRNGVFVAARIFHRFGVLSAEINGKPADPFQVWHGGDLITEEQYTLMMETPEANPYRRVFMSDAGLSERIKEQDEVDYWLTQPLR